MIDIEEAIYFLMTSSREEIVDNKLNVDGARWSRDSKTVAFGRFNSTESVVSITIDGRTQVFVGEEALRLRRLGVLSNSAVGKLYSEARDIIVPESTTFEEKVTECA